MTQGLKKRMMMSTVHGQFAACFVLVIHFLAVSSQKDRLPRQTQAQYDKRLPFENLPEARMMNPVGVSNKNYRALIFSDNQAELYVGGMEELLLVDPSNMKITSNITVPTTTSAGTACGMDIVCRNYVRIIQPFGEDDDLFVCGTDAKRPKCYFFDKTNMDLINADPEFSTDNNVPSEPHQNSSWFYMKEDSKLFSSVGAGSSRSRVDYNFLLTNLTSFGMAYDAEDEVEADSSQVWLSMPDFVGDPFEYKGRIYFFFRELAVEHINAGKIVYSRVGSVCKNDTGGWQFSQLDNEFTTYQKARLDCSLKQDNVEFDYNELQDVYRLGTTVFAVFTTPRSSPASSAVCAYNLDEIAELFDLGTFKGQANNGELWTTPDTSDIPADVYKCGALPLPDSSVYETFLLKYPLMNVEVPNKLNYKNTATNSYLRESDAPLLLIDDVRLVQIVVDEDVKGTDVMFFGTERGTIIKAFLKEDNSAAILVDEIDLNGNNELQSPVLTMVKHANQSFIYTGTDNNVYKVPVQSCANKTKCECQCSLDPYCALAGEECTVYDTVYSTVSEQAGNTSNCSCGVTGGPITMGPITVVRNHPCPNCNKTRCPEEPCKVSILQGENANLNVAAYAPQGTNLTASEVACNCSAPPQTIVSSSACSGREFVTVSTVLNVLADCWCTLTFMSDTHTMEPLVTEIMVDQTDRILDPVCVAEASNYDLVISKYKVELTAWKDRVSNATCATDTRCIETCQDVNVN